MNQLLFNYTTRKLYLKLILIVDCHIVIVQTSNALEGDVRAIKPAITQIAATGGVSGINSAIQECLNNVLGMLQMTFLKMSQTTSWECYKLCLKKRKFVDSQKFFINVYGNDVCNVLERLFITFIKMLQTTFYEYYSFKPSSNVFKTFLKYHFFLLGCYEYSS